MPDPYQILGVSKAATAAELKSAYRKLAKKLHPDVNPGRKDIEQKFKEITAAYDLLSDEKKRARFDRGEVDAQGNERGFAGADPFGGAKNWGSYTRSGAGADPFSSFSAEDIFAEFMGAARGGGRGKKQSGPQRGADVTYVLNVPFAEAALGTKRRVTLESGKTIDVTIPPGTSDGDKLRLRGQGQEGKGTAAEKGDAIIEIRVEMHPHFVRDENNITLEVPISLNEAILGASIKVPTLDSQVSLKIPPGANSGTILRLKGKGIPGKSGAGDMFAKLKIVLPDSIPEDLTEMIEKWAKKNAYDPRQKLGWE